MKGQRESTETNKTLFPTKQALNGRTKKGRMKESGRVKTVIVSPALPIEDTRTEYQIGNAAKLTLSKWLLSVHGSKEKKENGRVYSCCDVTSVGSDVSGVAVIGRMDRLRYRGSTQCNHAEDGRPLLSLCFVSGRADRWRCDGVAPRSPGDGARQASGPPATAAQISRKGGRGMNAGCEL